MPPEPTAVPQDTNARKLEIIQRKREIIQRKREILVSQQAPAAPAIPETVSTTPEAPRLPVDINVEDVQKTGKLPEGVTLEQANAALSAQKAEATGVQPLKEEEFTFVDDVKLRLREANDELSPQQEVILKDIAPLLIGGVTGLAAKGALKSIPAFLRFAASNPTKAAIVAGAVEGVGFETGLKGATEQRLPTAGEAATGAALFGGIPAAGAALGAGKELLGKALPEALVKSAIKLKPNQKIKVAEDLAKMGEEVSAETAEQYLLKNRISGSPEEVATKLATIATDARKAKLDALAPLTQKFKSDKVVQFADEVVKVTDGVAGMEEVALKAAQLQKAVASKQGATLAQIDELKTLFDQNLNVFTIAGDVKSGVAKTGLANLRREAKSLIEKEAANLGISNIKQLNQDVILNHTLSRAIAGQSIGAGGNALVKLAEGIVGGGAGGAAIYAASGGDFTQSAQLALAGLGIVAGAKLFTPKARIKLANWMSKNLNEGEAGAFLKLLEGDRAGLDTKIAEKIRQGFKEAGAKIKTKAAAVKSTKGQLDVGEIAKDLGKNSTTKTIPKELEGLAKEARKFDTAEEFADSIMSKGFKPREPKSEFVKLDNKGSAIESSSKLKSGFIERKPSTREINKTKKEQELWDNAVSNFERLKAKGDRGHAGDLGFSDDVAKIEVENITGAATPSQIKITFNDGNSARLAIRGNERIGKAQNIDITFLDTSNKRKGIGTRVMREIAKIGTENNINKISISKGVPESQGFWEKFGFSPKEEGFGFSTIPFKDFLSSGAIK